MSAHLSTVYVGVLYLADCDVVSRLLESRCVVIAVSNDDADFVQNHGAHQLIGALHLNHDGLNIRGGLERERREGEGGKTEG